MPITPFLRGEEFPPELIESMGDAYTRACAELGLSDRKDSMTELVARHIITLAQRGVHTKTALFLMTVREFTVAPQ